LDQNTESFAAMENTPHINPVMRGWLLRYARIGALLLSMSVLCGQTIAQQHLHLQDSPADSCSICVQMDKASAGSPGARLSLAAAASCATGERIAVAEEVKRHNAYDSRAPPIV